MSVMLAVQSKTIASTPVETITKLTNDGTWWFEPKWDGVRCMAVCSGENVELINRRGDLITDRFPEITDALRGIGERDEEVTLDGEIIVFGDNGKPDFNLLAKRKVGAKKARALAERIPAHFIAFDLLQIGSHDYRQSPYIARRAVLEGELTGRIQLSPRTEDGSALWSFILNQELEGIVAKQAHSPWVPRRASSWVKMRRTNTVSCWAHAYEPGTGWAQSLVGALVLSLRDANGTSHLVGKVGTGFTKQQRKELLTHFDEHGHSSNLIVEVEYQEVTPDGVLRFPSFKGVRTDLNVEDCTIDQLTHMGGEA